MATVLSRLHHSPATHVIREVTPGAPTLVLATLTLALVVTSLVFSQRHEFASKSQLTGVGQASGLRMTSSKATNPLLDFSVTRNSSCHTPATDTGSLKLLSCQNQIKEITEENIKQINN
ncbi:hypothetical protein E2C01_024192 [Portunus trituberculatus]|uniref:Uncharacterized protein n=1 Tax=Portunus trituberculatus TaxID=210409 RepID=A0A5B7E9P3_PORTR|nr:hypothetical protein [Portunus trituberculatus]